MGDPEQAFAEIGAPETVEICQRLAQDRQVRRKLPGGGRLHIDRLVPFLCVYRRHPERRDAGTRSFITGEAAFLTAPGDALIRGGLRRLVKRIAETASARFGAFLVLEIWSAPDEDVPRRTHNKTLEPMLPPPAFRILERPLNRPGNTVNVLKFALEHIKSHRMSAEVQVVLQGSVHPPGLQPLLTAADAKRINCFVIGLEVLPVYRDGENGDPFPADLRRLHRGIGRALKKAFLSFSLSRTNTRPQHFWTLGRRKIERRAWEIDRQLAEVAAKTDVLFQVTPINAEGAWHEFQQDDFQRTPSFQYRPLSVDPLLLKRQLNLIRTERVSDATLAHMFRQTQAELDRQITLLSDIGTRRFLPGSLQVFGGVDSSLLELAHKLVEQRRPLSNETKLEGQVGAGAFARRAAQEIRAYRRRNPRFIAKVQVRDDMFSGLLSSGGHLLIGRETTIAGDRVEALIAHEVGTHLVTYYNGLAQPLRLLSTGLAGYDGLQEGLAVLSEYLVGGLTHGRLRMLAARVLAAHSLIVGAGFVETYRLLADEHQFDRRTAYTVTLRVYRGGGLTKDAVYLRGLVEIVEYLRRGGALEPLFVGKIAVEHVPIISELLQREVLSPPPLTPRYMFAPGVDERLAQVRQKIGIWDLAIG